MSLIVIGARYRNVHTGGCCVVSSKIFFNIQYFDDDDPDCACYCHYKKFLKHWVKE